MTYAPPPPASGYSEPLYEPQRIAGLAVAGLVFSLILCVPFLTSLIGLVLGITGYFVACKPNRSGKIVARLAIAISVLGLLGWGFVAYKGYTQVILPIRTATEFSQAIADGDASAAGALTAAPFNNDEIPVLIAKVRELGKFKEFEDPKRRGQPPVNPFRWKTVNGKTTYGFSGTFQFENSRQHGDFELTETPEGWRVTECKLADLPPATTRPGTTWPTTLPSIPNLPTPPEPPEKP